MPAYCLIICISIARNQQYRKYFQYWVLSENRQKKEFPARKTSVLIAKISSHTTQKIANPQKHCLRRRRSKRSVYSVCELVHNIMFESSRVPRTYFGVFDWLVYYAACDYYVN